MCILHAKTLEMSAPRGPTPFHEHWPPWAARCSAPAEPLRLRQPAHGLNASQRRQQHGLNECMPSVRLFHRALLPLPHRTTYRGRACSAPLGTAWPPAAQRCTAAESAFGAHLSVVGDGTPTLGTTWNGRVRVLPAPLNVRLFPVSVTGASKSSRLCTATEQASKGCNFHVQTAT